MKLATKLQKAGLRCKIHEMEETPCTVCKPDETALVADPVDHPAHYMSHPSGVEAITICEHMSFCAGNAVKYLMRAGLKPGADASTDLRKSAWYAEREAKRLEKVRGK